MRARHTFAVLFSSVAVAAGLTLCSPQAADASSYYTPGAQRMSGPSLDSTQDGWYSRGANLDLTCYRHGQTVSGPYANQYSGGTSDLWYRVSDGDYVAATAVYTGSSSPVTSACAVQHTSSSDSRAKAAVAWASSMIGSQSYADICERFVENAYGTTGQEYSAMTLYQQMRQNGKIHTSGMPPEGALVFSSNPNYDQGYGHVELSEGDGSYISGGADGPTVKRYWTAAPGPGNNYLGWSYAPSNWPGR